MPLKVLIAGAGPAGLEAALALRDLAGERVALTLLAPDEELVYRPLSVAEPFAIASARRYPLGEIARDVGAERVVDTLAAVDPEARTVATGSGRTLAWDALIVAVGARAEPALPHATTFWGPGDAQAVQGLVQDVEEGYAKRIAFVVPPGVTWPLPLYELALLTAARAYESQQTVELDLITPEDAPLNLFGPAAAESIAALLAEAGVRVRTGAYAEDGGRGVLTLRPAGESLTFDRVVALPRLAGRPIPGLPADPEGFVPIDEFTRARGLDGIYVAGDLTDFPLKQGGIATQQADVAARAIAAAAGAGAEPEPFRPVLRGMLLTGTGAWWLRAEPAGGAGEGELAGHALWWPPSKIAGRWLSPYLSERDQESVMGAPPGKPLELRFSRGPAPAGEHGSTLHPVEVLALEQPPPAGDQGGRS
jgi:sulfide:quinone oxidoreductase